ncbi:MAG: hypothetical protein JRD49_14100 [Deltaproteobacteria bacterium]|nr:hypothetical protein [Deltaproteobacteria bacterium]
MLRIIDDFKGYPPSVKKAIVFTVIAWGWFYVSLSLIDIYSETHTIIQPSSELFKQYNIKSGERGESHESR